MEQIVVVGSLNMDQVVRVREMPQKGETILGLEMSKNPGGKGANQAYAIGKLGGKISMIGAVGKDEAGKLLKRNLESVGVDTDAVIELEDTPSGIAVIMVDQNAQNSIVVMQGANRELTKADIDSHMELLKEADVVVMQLEIPLDVVTYTAKLASEMGKTVILDPAPAVAELPAELLAHVDIIKPNESELATLTGMPTGSPEEAARAAAVLLEKGIANVIVTMGELGSILVTKEGVHRFPCERIKAVDTTAAGDSFTAAFAVALTKGKSYEEAIAYGNRVSAITVTRKGAQASIPDKEEAAL